MNTHVDLSPSWQVKFGRTKGMGPEKDMAQEKGMALEEKGMALGKRGMARRHAKRGWGKHYLLLINITCSNTNVRYLKQNIHKVDAMNKILYYVTRESLH